MNKNHRDQTQFFSRKKRFRKKENEFVIVYILGMSAITQTNRQTIYSFNDIEAPGLHIIQCYNIYNTVIIMIKKDKL